MLYNGGGHSWSSRSAVLLVLQLSLLYTRVFSQSDATSALVFGNHAGQQPSRMGNTHPCCMTMLSHVCHVCFGSDNNVPVFCLKYYTDNWWKNVKESKKKRVWTKNSEGKIDGRIATSAKSFLLISGFNFRIKISWFSKCPQLSVPDII